MVHVGERGEYHWLVSQAEVFDLTGLVLRYHRGLRLCVSSCDSRPLRLGQEELARGWTTRGEVAVSPPLEEALPIPQGGYDEWYLVRDPSFADQRVEVFVNYEGFTLLAPAATPGTGDPPPGGGDTDRLAALRERFWSQLERLKPETYVALGDHDVVVARNPHFIEVVRRAAEPTVTQP